MAGIVENTDPQAEMQTLAQAEALVKQELANETFALIECIRQHPDITQPVDVAASQEGLSAEVMVFSHFMTHIKRINHLAAAAEGIVKTFLGKADEMAPPNPQDDALLQALKYAFTAARSGGKDAPHA